jgi:hypothetical protein
VHVPSALLIRPLFVNACALTFPAIRKNDKKCGIPSVQSEIDKIAEATSAIRLDHCWQSPSAVRTLQTRIK